MNSTEVQLRSWEPRRPSAKLKHKLFAEARPRRQSGHLTWQWLAPAAACLLLAITMFNPNNGLVNGTATQESLTLVSSNLNPLILAEDALNQSKHNHPANRIEWTNGSAFTSSVSSFLPGQVN